MIELVRADVDQNGSIEFWNNWISAFGPSTLASLALKCCSLGCQTSSVEELFSQWGRIHTKVRNRLNPQTTYNTQLIAQDVRKEGDKRIHDATQEVQKEASRPYRYIDPTERKKTAADERLQNDNDGFFRGRTQVKKFKFSIPTQQDTGFEERSNSSDSVSDEDNSVDEENSVVEDSSKRTTLDRGSKSQNPSIIEYSDSEIASDSDDDPIVSWDDAFNDCNSQADSNASWDEALDNQEESTIEPIVYDKSVCGFTLEELQQAQSDDKPPFPDYNDLEWPLEKGPFGFRSDTFKLEEILEEIDFHSHWDD